MGPRAPTRVETDRRPSGHSYHRSGRTYYYDPYWRYRGYGGWWGGFYWPWWWYDDYYYYPHPSYRHDWRAENYQSDSGALDFDVSPERAEIYVDGRFVGIADDYDGFPEYLWLPRAPTTSRSTSTASRPSSATSASLRVR